MLFEFIKLKILKVSFFISTIILHFVLLNISTAQKNSSDFLDRGISHYTKGEYEKAINEFSSCINENHSLHLEEAYDYRGNSYLYLKKYKQAILDFETLIRLNPKHLNAYMMLGKIYHALKEYNTSISYYSKVIEINPFDSKAHNDRGISKCQQGNYNDAIKDFIQAISLDSTFAIAYNNAGTARYYNQDIDNPVKKDMIQAKDYFSKAIELNPTFSMAYRNRGAMNLFLGLYDEALEDLTIAEKLDPNLAIISFYKGMVFFKIKKNTAAIHAFQEAIEKKHTFTFAYEEIGDTYKKLNRYDDAISYYQKAARVTHKHQEQYKGLMNYKQALIYALQKDEFNMYVQLHLAKKNNVFKDKRVFDKFLTAKEFKSFRVDKSFRKFTKSITKIKKESKFIQSELHWFRMDNE